MDRREALLARHPLGHLLVDKLEQAVRELRFVLLDSARSAAMALLVPLERFCREDHSLAPVIRAYGACIALEKMLAREVGYDVEETLDRRRQVKTQAIDANQDKLPRRAAISEVERGYREMIEGWERP